MSLFNSTNKLLAAAVQILLLFSVPLLALLSPLTPAYAGIAPATQAPETVEFELANGLKVIFQEEHAFPVVSTLMWYRVGARNESAGITGLCHMVEHLLFGNVGGFKNGEIGSAIVRNGGLFNGFTSDDFMMFFETLTPSKLDLAMKIESERMRRANFTQAEIESESTNIKSEYEAQGRDPVDTLSQEVRSIAYRNHPYHNPTMGWKTDLPNITVQEVRAFYDKFFWPDNAVLVISGDIRLPAVQALVKKYFGQIKRGPGLHSDIQVVEPSQQGERRVNVKFTGRIDPNRQEVMQIAYHAPAAMDADGPAFVVLEKLLNASVNGRLRSRFVASKLCSSAFSSFEARKYPGLFTFTCFPLVGTGQQKVLDALDNLITVLKAQPITESDLKRAKNLAEFSFFSEVDTPYNAAFRLGYFESLSQWQDVQTWADRLRAVTSADIQRVARIYFSSDERVVGYLSPFGASHPPAAKPAAPGAPAQKGAIGGEPASHFRRAEHTRMTGFKFSDSTASGEISTGTMAGNAVASALVGKSSGAGIEPPDLVVAVSPSIVSASTGSASIASASTVPPSAVFLSAVSPSTAPASTTSAPANLPPSFGRSTAQLIAQLPLPIDSAGADHGNGAASGTSDNAAGSSNNSSSGNTANSGNTGSIVNTGNTGTNSIPPHMKGLTQSDIKKLDEMRAREIALQRVQERTLKNGMKLIVLESHITPVVQVFGACQAGWVYDPPGKKGLSEMSVSILNQGSSRHTHSQFIQIQEDLGLTPTDMIDFEDAGDQINFGTRCLSRDLSGQLSLLLEPLLNPTLLDADFEKARQDVLNSIRQNENSTTSRVEHALLRNLVSGASPYHPAEAVERAKNIALFKASDVKSYLSDYIAPASTTIVMSGDINIEQAQAMLESSLSSWTGKGHAQKIALQPASRHIVRVSLPVRDRSPTLICLGQLVPVSQCQVNDYADLLIADCAMTRHPLVRRLGGNRKDKFATELYGDNKLDCRLEDLGGQTCWSLTLNIEPNTVSSSVERVRSDMQTLSRNGLLPMELAECKRYLFSAIPIKRMGGITAAGGTLLDVAGAGAGTSTNLDNLEPILNAIRAASLESVNKFLGSTFKASAQTLVIAGPKDAIQTTHK